MSGALPAVYDPDVPRGLRHFPPLAPFAGLTALWLLAVARDPSVVVPGTGAGDNLTFIWNAWWMHHAVASLAWPFRTSSIFVPWGVDLTLNSHAALPSLLAAGLSGALG